MKLSRITISLALFLFVLLSLNAIGVTAEKGLTFRDTVPTLVSEYHGSEPRRSLLQPLTRAAVSKRSSRPNMRQDIRPGRRTSFPHKPAEISGRFMREQSALHVDHNRVA